MSTYAINHCGLRDEIKGAGLSKADFQEAVMERAGQIVAAVVDPKKRGKRHPLPGVELAAKAVANDALDKGAAKLAKDFNVDLQDLKKLASSQHISFC